MNYTETWNFLCTEHQAKYDKSEAEIQHDWENYFAETELFGYSRIKNDIVSHPQLVLGSTEREIPDILLCKNGEKLFVSELKQYSIAKTDKIEKQLLNYLTHTDIHLSIGILVCEKLYIYCYDFNANSKIEFEIPFEENNANGIKFMELFNKKNFDEKKIQDFVFQNHLSTQNVSEIKSDISVDLIKDLLKEHFLEKYSQEDFEKAIEKFEISVSEKININKTIENNISALSDKKSNGRKEKEKNKFLNLCECNGIEIDENCFTLASRGNGRTNKNKYWANPDFSFLTRKWTLILNDWSKNIIYVFILPPNSLQKSNIKLRTDNNEKIDFQFKYGDVNFTDTRSKIEFKQWLVKSISY
jgi:hypothetical protein